ncbi:MAG: NfeD family protein [Thiotrichaceae bacterium]|nr:NfeD family protein [Thiotrichaceae bacterium]
MPDNNTNNLQQQISYYKRLISKRYLQYINPRMGKVLDLLNEPMVTLSKILPNNIPKWLAIAASVTGLLILFWPYDYWSWQIVIFLLVFFFGPSVVRFLSFIKDSFYSLLVAYPGKYLLNEEITLEQAIESGKAEITMQGENWKLRGDDSPSGTKVRVIAIKKDVLFVKPII